MIIVLFGYPGTGKTYVGKIFEKYFSFYLYEGDVDMPKSMKIKVTKNYHISDRDRDKLFDNIERKIKVLRNIYKKLVITQTFIKEKYREQILKANPDARFIYIKTDDEIRQKRLAKRETVPLSRNYADQMIKNFDKPKIDHLIIYNNKDGENEIKKQIYQCNVTLVS
ncbi:MAG: hypothetical protein UR68_C0012G0009 [Candidatus Roizmanbacteria bacterium GW2011_GWA2_35_19]|uniref:Uncharacterized protein n=2 Tax=Candidatus Roizmaniibacteriota TaxID=1752723 RepID=A0A0G0C9K3_9BACT|nr:MAG: hypothetical protein UR63_C0031G0009 [Candidatus Roizmanbacteria bacterium GW2011_GWC2_35_12]KKP72816.1 MAG: hypothetical protein UR68_C0012G0009 [Candidatus Roizmanbacteria bacterium GW2011_GWA2_35_19]